MIQPSTQEYFTQEELIQIYHHAGVADQDALVASARELFPKRWEGAEPPFILVETGNHGRWFVQDPDQPAVPPVYTIKSGHCNCVGVLEDGTALPY